MPVRKAIWKSDAQFNYGTPIFDDTVVRGEGDSAKIRLTTENETSEHITFSDPADFDYDPTKIEIDGGKATLKSTAIVGSDDFSFTTPANYVYDPAKIEIVGGKAKLLNKKLNGNTSWPFTNPANYTISPVGSIDIVDGNAQLHDQGSHTNNSDVGYNIPANYTYDPLKIEFVDKGGGNYAAALKGSGGFDLEGWWHLNESSGGTAADSSGKSHHGTLVNMEDADWVPCKLNNGLIFDGVDEYINCGQIGSYERTDAFAGDMWVYKSITTQITPIFSKMNPSYVGWMFGLNGLKVTMMIRNAGNYIFVNSTPSIPLNTWTHIAFSYDGSGVASGVSFWIDSTPAAHTGTDNLAGKTILNTTDFKICSGLAGGLSYLNGKADELALYNVAIDQTQVTARYNGGAGTESMATAGYPIDNPTVVQNFDAAFGTVLEWEAFTETVTKPAGTAIKYNISNDSGVTWYYWNGATWIAADGTYAQSNTNTEIVTNIHLFGVGNQTLRIKAFLNSEGGETPELDNVNIVWYDVLSSYATDGRITTNTGIDTSPNPVWSWDSFAETVTEPAGTEVRYALSNDNGVTWLYWSGAAWMASDGVTWAQFCSGAEVSANVGVFPLVNPKMKIRAYLKTTDSTKTPELDNVQVLYKYGYSYDATDPTVESDYHIGPTLPNPLVSFDTFIETATKPTGTEVKYIISDDDGTTWYYWTGAWVVSNETYTQSNTAAEILAQISTFPPDNKMITIRAFLHTGDTTKTAELDNVHIDWTEVIGLYPTTPQEFAMNYDIQPAAVFFYVESIHTVTKPVNTTIKHQYSIDAGVSWSGTWFTADESELVFQDIICGGAGTDTLRLKFQLATTDNLVTPEIDNVEIVYSATGYKLLGTYTSTQYIPVPSETNGIFVEDVTFDVDCPAGTSLVVRARVVEHVLEENYDKPWTEYASGESVSMCGKFIQFEAVLATTDVTKSPKLNWVEIGFHLLIGLMRNIDVSTELNKKILKNRLELTDGSENNWILYDDDDTTPLLTWHVKDKTGGAITQPVGVPSRRSRGT